MHAELKAQVAFHLTGKRPPVELDAVAQLHVRSALLARYRDLTSLRYDYPLVLVQGSGEARTVLSLTGIVNGLLRELAPQGIEGEKIRKHVLRLEREIRVLLAGGASGSLSALWGAAAARVTAADPGSAGSVERARALLDVDGPVVDCDAATPGALLLHAWHGAQERKAGAFRKNVNGLIQKLTDILRSDYMHAGAGLSPESLKAAVGSTHAEVFDFEVMARVLGKSLPRNPLPQGRRARVEWALNTLQGQRFYELPERHADRGHTVKPHNFAFETCTGALKAYRERLPEMVELAKAIAMAELEVEGLYAEAQHDAFFRDYTADMLDASDAAVFPDYLIRVHAAHMQAAEHERLHEVLASSLPMKVLLQSDDVLDACTVTGMRPAFGLRSLQLARAAMECNMAYVVQAAASHLYQFRDRISAGMTYNGPALFSVYSGAPGGAGALPAYLNAAAAMTCRAFPAYVYDPSAGENLATRFWLDDNPDADRDWPVQQLNYEDENHQSVTENLAFTFADFVASDPRYSEHFARVPRDKWNEQMVPVSGAIAGDGKAGETVPYLLLTDDQGRLHRVIADDRLIREARRCREMWHNLQELGGIHSSHAERLLAREKKIWQEEQQRAAPATASAPPSVVAVPAAAAPVEAAAAAQPAVEEKKSDDPYIETPRCSSCNECTLLNPKMFAYDGNKQAYIANPDAGTYRELVEAAESCQVSVIHPGKPRNPNEPGLDELLARAEPFM
jgi:hypothetical protein